MDEVRVAGEAAEGDAVGAVLLGDEIGVAMAVTQSVWARLVSRMISCSYTIGGIGDCSGRLGFQREIWEWEVMRGNFVTTLKSHYFN